MRSINDNTHKIRFSLVLGDIDKGKKIWDTPFRNGKTFAETDHFTLPPPYSPGPAAATVSLGTARG